MRPPLRHLLVLLALLSGQARAQHLGPRQVDALPASTPTAVVAYGQDPLQYGELRVPAGAGPFPVVIVIHGGCWTKGFATARNTAAAATRLTEQGVVTWNVEYRQQGDAGAGWPGTFLDWAAATDLLRTLAKSYPLDLSHVVATGHSAGAQAALWLAARPRLPKDSPILGGAPLPVHAAVAIDGPGDLAGLVGPDASICGKPVIAPWMGGTPVEQPARYQQASALALLPLHVPQVLVASVVLTPKDAADYAKAARGKGDQVEVLVLHDAGHFDMLAPGNPAWEQVQQRILGLARDTTP
jgi:acetyl esterase/lipase